MKATLGYVEYVKDNWWCLRVYLLCTQVHRVWSSTTSLESSQFNGPQRAEYILKNILEYKEYIIKEAQRVMKCTWFCTRVWIVWKFTWVSQTHLDYILQILEYDTTVQSTKAHFTQSHWMCRLRKCIYRATESWEWKVLNIEGYTSICWSECRF